MVAQILKVKDFFFSTGRETEACLHAGAKRPRKDEEIYFYVLLPRETVSS